MCLRFGRFGRQLDCLNPSLGSGTGCQRQVFSRLRGKYVCICTPDERPTMSCSLVLILGQNSRCPENTLGLCQLRVTLRQAYSLSTFSTLDECRERGTHRKPILPIVSTACFIGARTVGFFLFSYFWSLRNGTRFIHPSLLKSMD